MPGGEKNTFGLPDGEEIRLEMVAIFREQRLALLDWMDSEGYKAFGLPSSWPSWESLKLGAADIAARVKGPIADIWEQSAKSWMALNGMDPGRFDVTAPPVSTAIDAQANTLGANVNATTTGRLNRLLSGVTDLFNRGKLALTEAIKRLRDGITEMFKSSETGRARTIAVTEASRAYHEAIADVASKDPEIIGWRWTCAEGACPICLEIEAEAPIVRVGQAFAIIGTDEYSDIFYPPAHPGCRCSMQEVTTADEETGWSDTLVNPDPGRVGSPVPY